MTSLTIPVDDTAGAEIVPAARCPCNVLIENRGAENVFVSHVPADQYGALVAPGTSLPVKVKSRTPLFAVTETGGAETNVQVSYLPPTTTVK